MSKPMRVKVKYVQGYFYIINGDIKLLFRFLKFFIGLGVMAEKLNHYINFLFSGVFFVHPAPPPPKKIQNSKNATI